MRILLSAASCSPYSMSESIVGWKVATHLAQKHEVHALVFQGFEKDLRRAGEEGLIPPNLHFHYAGPTWDRFPDPAWEKEFWWKSYMTFLKQIEAKAIALHAMTPFDMAHHITFATWRLAVPLHRLGVPFVFGPVGGAEKFPPSLLGILSMKAVIFEFVRYASNILGRMSPGLRDMVRQADAIVASNPDAFELLEKMRGTSDGIHSLLVSTFTEKERGALANEEKPPRRDPQIIYAFAGGAVEGRKGMSMALDAIALAKSRGLRIRYRVGGVGPEIGHLREHARKLGLENEVVFGAPLQKHEYVRELLSSDVYLLPSLRDNGPLTLMESMLAGCVPVVAACGGPNVIVSDECGYRVPVSSRRSLIEGIADALLDLQNNPDRMRALGLSARARILQKYTMESYLETIDNIYQAAISSHSKKRQSA